MEQICGQCLIQVQSRVAIMSNSPNRAKLTDPKFAEPLGERPRLDFALKTFAVAPAMVKKKPVTGHRLWSKLDPERFNEEEHEIVEGKWDHEHCAVCWERIVAEAEYWENSEKHILCPKCHSEFLRLT